MTEYIDAEYKVLKEIESNPHHTQRTLAAMLDVSLGKMNYILAGLIEKGIVKAKRLKNEPGKIRWRYLLTPKGIREKVKLTRDYLARREKEFIELQKEIAMLKMEVGEKK